MLPTLDLPAKDKFMFDLLSIYEMKEDIANNTAAIAELGVMLPSTAHPKELFKRLRLGNLTKFLCT